jgi:hypothetical protein
MTLKSPPSPSTASKTSATTKDTRDSSPPMASTPATSIPPTSPQRIRSRYNTKEESPTQDAQDIVTQEMRNEESELHQQADVEQSSQQVSPLPLPITRPHGEEFKD